ncbi:hypothetical protein [Salinispora pacifica]|uniref:hypothetical protein n=1 Tax=Salinispora pacifica TaxID=351187 RepID=UPI00036171D3|nr:hypothetical protein [Salinispora pacifica]
MRFSVVDVGYDQRQVDSCLDELGVRLSRLAARAEGAARAGREWDEIREEAAGLCGVLQRLDLGDLARRPVDSPDREAAEREVTDLLLRARLEFDAAREEARRVREQAYTEAVQARRELEAALHARRCRAVRVDEILGGPTEAVPTDTPTAASAVAPSRVVH